MKPWKYSKVQTPTCIPLVDTIYSHMFFSYKTHLLFDTFFQKQQPVFVDDFCLRVNETLQIGEIEICFGHNSPWLPNQNPMLMFLLGFVHQRNGNAPKCLSKTL